MQMIGHCQCGAVEYQVTAPPKWVAVCHCRDCQLSAGAPMVAWAIFPESAFSVTRGEPKTFNSSGTAMRTFCPDCGTGLFYRNAASLPGMVDIQATTFDDPGALPPGVQVQAAERQSWVTGLENLPVFERYPTPHD